MIQPWLCSLAAAASGTELRGLLVARDVWLEWEPLEPKAARTQLDRWLYACRQGLRAPLPLPRRTAGALLESDAAARTAYEGNSQMDGEALDPAWARFYPDYDALAADGSLAQAAQALWAPLFPLQGSRLIEASAGTGKTWTIAALYLRLVLGHGGATRPGRRCCPREILVMTFTGPPRASCRPHPCRLVQAAAVLSRGEDACQRTTPSSPRCCRTTPRAGRAQQAAWRLAMAAEAMDDAAVHTIDAWCQRMLREHAFDSGCLFDEELRRRARACWPRPRRTTGASNATRWTAAAQWRTPCGRWPTVDALRADVAPLLDGWTCPPMPAQGTLATLASACKRTCRALEPR
jgi:hypothetical protein